jgi:hypothetical protein
MKNISLSTGAHEDAENGLGITQPVAEFLLRLPTDAGFRVILVEKPRARLDQRLGMAAHIGRQPELPDEQHGAALRIVGQNHGTMAAVIGLPNLPFQSSVAAPIIEGELLENRPVVREDFDRANENGSVSHVRALDGTSVSHRLSMPTPWPNALLLFCGRAIHF